MSPCRRRQTCPCPPTRPACVNWRRSFGSTSTAPCALALCHENANHVSQRDRTFTLSPAVRRYEMVCAPEQTDAQHQADSHASGRSSGLPQTWALAHPSVHWFQQPQAALLAQSDFHVTGPQWVSAAPGPQVTPTLLMLLRYQGPSGSHKSRPLTHPSICWLQQPQVVSTNASSLPTPALGGFHDPRQLPDTCLPMDFSQSRPLITEPDNSHGTRLLTSFWELRMKNSKEILWAL